MIMHNRQGRAADRRQGAPYCFTCMSLAAADGIVIQQRAMGRDHQQHCNPFVATNNYVIII